MGDYLKRFRDRVNVRGDTRYEQLQSMKVETFNDYLTQAPTYQISISNQLYTVAIEDISYGERNKFDKVLLASLGTPIVLGTSFKWDNKDWIVVRLEKETVPSNISAKLKECNNSLNWKANEVTITVPCVISDRTISGFIEEENFLMPSGKVLVVVPNNTTTKTFIKRGKRFLVNGSVAYKAIYIDEVTQPGLLYITMEEDILLAQDDKVNNIAFNNTITTPVTEIPTEVGYDIVIMGDYNIKINNQRTFTAQAYLDGQLINNAQFTWLLTNLDDTVTTYASLLSVTNTSCAVKAGNKVSKVKLKCVLDGHADVVKNMNINITPLF
jgi:hypothetical protein